MTRQTNGQAVNEVKQQLEDLAISASEQELEEINNSNKSTSAKTEWNDLSANADQKENNGFEATTSKPQDNIEDPYAHPPGATEDKAFLGAADAEQTTKTESSLPVPPSSTAEAASGLDNLSFVNWKKGFKKPDVSKYRKEQPVSGPEQANGVLGNADDNTFGGDSWGADTTAVGGWDGAASPTYLIEHGLMAPLPDIEDDGVTFSITGTFPFNTNGVANGLSSRFGEDALALYQVPIEHERIGGFNFEKTVTYYARFRELCAPAYERQAICLEPKSGDGGNGWYINLDPVDAIAPNAYMIRDQPSLVGYVDY